MPLQQTPYITRYTDAAGSQHNALTFSYLWTGDLWANPAQVGPLTLTGGALFTLDTNAVANGNPLIPFRSLLFSQTFLAQPGATSGGAISMDQGGDLAIFSRRSGQLHRVGAPALWNPTQYSAVSVTEGCLPILPNDVFIFGKQIDNAGSPDQATGLLTVTLTDETLTPYSISGFAH